MRRTLLIACFLLLVGCSGAREANQIIYVSGIGIDYVKPHYLFTIQFMNFSELAKTELTGEVKHSVAIGTGRGRSVSEAADDLYRTMPEKVSWGHVKSIVFTTRALQHPSLMRETIDYFNRFYELRQTSWIYATDIALNRLFTVHPFFTRSPFYSRLSNPEQLFRQFSEVYPVRFQRLTRSFFDPHDVVRIPKLAIAAQTWSEDRVATPQFRYDGYAFMEEKRYRGSLNERDISGTRWLEKGMTRLSLQIRDGPTFVANVIVMHPHFKTTIKGNRAHLTIDVNGEVLQDGRNRSLRDITKLTERYIQHDVKTTWLKAKQQNIDVYGWQQMLYRQKLRQQPIQLGNITVKAVIRYSGNTKLTKK